MKVIKIYNQYPTIDQIKKDAGIDELSVFVDHFIVTENNRFYNVIKRKNYILQELKPFKEKNGYYSVKKVYCHRLLGKAFIKNPNNKPNINHINGIKTDNRLSNLEWVTASENTKHAYEKGLNYCSTKKLNDLQVSIVKRLNGIMMHKDISKIFNVEPMVISRAISGARYKNHSFGNWKTNLL